MQQAVVTFVDDLGDGECDAHRGTILRLNDRTVEVDLSDKNFRDLYDYVVQYLDAGRRVPHTVSASTRNSRGRRTEKADRPDPAAVRAYFEGLGRGDEIAPRGRISKKLIEEFNAAHDDA